MKRIEFEWLRHNLAKSTYERMVTAMALVILVTLMLVGLKLTGIGEWLYCTFPLLFLLLMFASALSAMEIYLIVLERQVEK